MNSDRRRILNGNFQDLKQAEDLYEQDREPEALRILDRVLSLSADPAADAGRLRALLDGNPDSIFVDPKVVGYGDDGSAVVSLEAHLGAGMIRTMVHLRSRCLAAIIDRPDLRSDPQVVACADHNVALVTYLFPDDPELTVFCAQVVFARGDAARAIRMAETALQAQPDLAVARTTLEIFRRGWHAQGPLALTREALALISATVEAAAAAADLDLGALRQAGEQLVESLSIAEAQAAAWAGLAWIGAMCGNREEASDAMRKALALDPGDPLVRQLVPEFRRRGWWTEVAARGTGASWPVAGYDAGRTGAVAESLHLPLRLSVTYGDCAPIGGGIATSGLTAVFGDRDGIIHAVNVRTGKRIWVHQLGGVMAATPAIREDRVFVGSPSGAACLDIATGRELWRHDPPPRNERPPVHLGCPLPLGQFVLFSTNELILLEAETGKLAGQVATHLECWSHCGVAADQERVYIPSLRRVLRLTSATGEFTTPIDIDGKITSGPVLAGGLLLCGTHYGTLCAVSLHDGSSAWTFKLHREGRWMVESRPVVADGKVFFTGPDGRLYSLDLATGSEHWSVDLGVASESCPLIAGAAVYVLTSKGLAAFAGEDGRLLWSCTEGTSWTAATAALAIAAGRLIAATDRLQVFAPVT